MPSGAIKAAMMTVARTELLEHGLEEDQLESLVDWFQYTLIGEVLDQRDGAKMRWSEFKTQFVRELGDVLLTENVESFLADKEMPEAWD
jgi:hypothetical protein